MFSKSSSSFKCFSSGCEQIVEVISPARCVLSVCVFSAAHLLMRRLKWQLQDITELEDAFSAALHRFELIGFIMRGIWDCDASSVRFLLPGFSSDSPASGSHINQTEKLWNRFDTETDDHKAVPPTTTAPVETWLRVSRLCPLWCRMWKRRRTLFTSKGQRVTVGLDELWPPWRRKRFTETRWAEATERWSSMLMLLCYAGSDQSWLIDRFWSDWLNPDTLLWNISTVWMFSC